MASKKQKGRAATVAPPAPAATARPSLPEGFERITDDDGDELVQPTPKQAVADLLDVLLSVPPWERFPADPDEWTSSQIRERGRPRQGHVMVAGVTKDGEAFEVELRDDRRQNDRLVRVWEQRTGRRRTAKVPKILRSAIDERRQLHAGFDVFVPQAIKAVVAAGGNAAPLRELERDEELHADTVAAAVAELRRMIAPAAEVDAPAQNAKAKTPIDTAKDATCNKIRKALSMEPDGLLLKPLVARCGGDQKRTTIKNRLKLMEDVEQTGNRGAYRLKNVGTAQQRRD